MDKDQVLWFFLKYEKDKYIKQFVDIMYEKFLQPCITEPSRIVNGQRPSIVDNIFTNIINKKIIGGNLTSKVSDHMPNFVLIEDLIQKTGRKKITKRDFSNFKEEDYLYDLSTISIDQVLFSNNINEIYNEFHHQIVNIIDKHAPIKTFSNRESKWLQKPWFTKGIQKSIKIKNRMYKKYIKANKDPFWYGRYKFYNNSIKKITELSKKKHYNNYFQKHAKNSRKIWQGINECANNRKAKVSDIFLNENGAIEDNPKNVANKFNRYFSNVASNLLQKMPKPSTKFQDYLKNPNKHTFYLNEVDPGEVFKLLSNLDITKSGDIFAISPKLIKPAAHILCFPISKIINKSFNLGAFPRKLKIGKIIPIHKSESKSDPSNYRPISLLPIISKIFEKVMYSRMYEFIQKYKILYDKQYGFQKGKSTEQALLNLQSNILSKLEKGLIPCSIFLDFSKAFDTVNHNILLEKLSHYGFRGNALDWLRSYLEDRKQCVFVSGRNSDYMDVKHGVPQGSILGPLLFLIYINDIANICNIFTVYLFADDASLFCYHKNQSELEKIINLNLMELSKWLTANKLSLNIKKSKILFFRRKQDSNKLKSKIELNNEILEEIENIKYLGITIDNKLTFNRHIDHISQKITKGNSLIAKVRHFIPPDLLKLIYNAHIQPFLDYGILSWSVTSQGNLSELTKLQCKSVRLINFKNKNQPIEPLLKTSNILPINLNINLASCKFLWKLKNGYFSPTMQDIFTNMNVLQSQRNQTKYIVPHANLEPAKRFITYEGVKNWNKIPNEIVNSSSLKSFSKSYKNKLISTIGK